LNCPDHTSDTKLVAKIIIIIFGAIIATGFMKSKDAQANWR